MRTSRKESSGGVVAGRPPGTAPRQAAMAEGADGAGRAEAGRDTALRDLHGVFQHPNRASLWPYILSSHEISINTERSHVGPWVRTVSHEELSGVLKDMDRLASAVSSRSVVDDAFFEIENLRHEYLSQHPTGSTSSTAKLDHGHNASVTSNLLRVPNSSSNVHTQGTSAKNLCGSAVKTYASTLYSWPSTTGLPYTSSLQSTTSQSGNTSLRDRNGNNAQMANGRVISPERKQVVQRGESLSLKGDPLVNSCRQSVVAHYHRPLALGLSLDQHSTSRHLTKRDEDTKCFTSNSYMVTKRYCECENGKSGLEYLFKEEVHKSRKGSPVLTARPQESWKSFTKLIKSAYCSQVRKNKDSVKTKNGHEQTLESLGTATARGKLKEGEKNTLHFQSSESPRALSKGGREESLDSRGTTAGGVCGDHLSKYKRDEERDSVSSPYSTCFPFSDFTVSVERSES
ncbi:hypothetical protein C0Q70_14697 [Pomacea canaliculata]|uniref:Uncharacterized protein n=1 Tax=Pomacea canaliculata TaxID=400727 RepID=A0A2T7NSS1_POMCA|nr:hypothetical protein C0Q70_14697 [Pomacea canaliculata]